MAKRKKKIAVGFIVYKDLTAKYLPYFLPSLWAAAKAAAEHYNFSFFAFDNSGPANRVNANFLHANYPQIKILSVGKNIGFARAYNKMIAAAAEADYFLVINPDILLVPTALRFLAKALDDNKNLAAVSPKVRRWDFHLNRQTNIIDTCGLSLAPGLRFYDLGQGESDRGQHDQATIIGPSGAAGLFRLSALAKIKEAGQYFDERFFMYKEDCDLAYRLYLAGFQASCVPSAVIYHDRTAAVFGPGWRQVILSRRQKSRQVKKWSFFGQQLIFLKYWRRQNWQSKLAIISYEIKALVFALLFEPYLLAEWRRAFKVYRNTK